MRTLQTGWCILRSYKGNVTSSCCFWEAAAEVLYLILNYFQLCQEPKKDACAISVPKMNTLQTIFFSFVSFFFPHLAGSEVFLRRCLALLRLHAYAIPLSVFMGSLRHAVNLTLAMLQARQSTELPLVQYQWGGRQYRAKSQEGGRGS